MNRPLLAALLLFAPLAAAAAWPDDPYGAFDGIEPTPCRSATAEPLSLGDAVDLALCANPQTREAWAHARAQAALAGAARGAWWPALSADLEAARQRAGGASPSRDERAGLALSWLVADFGTREATLAGARELLAAAAASRESTVQAVLLAAVQAYFQTQAAEATLDAARRSEAAYEASHRAAEARRQVGAATPADQLQARTALSQARLATLQAEGALRTARGALATVLGRPADQPVALVPAGEALPGTGFDEDVGALIALARERRPDLAAAEARLRAARAEAAAARAAGLPTLSLGAAAGRSRLDGAPWGADSSVGLTLSMPLFAGYAYHYRARAAEARADAEAASRDRLGLQVGLDVWTAYQALVTARQSLATTADLLASAGESARVAAGRYQAGVGSILDLLTAQSALAAARQQRVQALHGWNVSRAALAFAVGRLDLALVDRLAAPTEKARP